MDLQSLIKALVQSFGGLFPVKLCWAGPDPTYANFILIQIIQIQKMLGEFWVVELHNIIDWSQMEQSNGSAILDQGFGAKFWRAFPSLALLSRYRSHLCKLHLNTNHTNTKNVGGILTGRVAQYNGSISNGAVKWICNPWSRLWCQVLAGFS